MHLENRQGEFLFHADLEKKQDYTKSGCDSLIAMEEDAAAL